MKTMMISGLKVNVDKGFDCFRGKVTCEHFATYAQAKAYAAKYPKTTIRYWKAEEEVKN